MTARQGVNINGVPLLLSCGTFFGALRGKSQVSRIQEKAEISPVGISGGQGNSLTKQRMNSTTA